MSLRFYLSFIQNLESRNSETLASPIPGFIHHDKKKFKTSLMGAFLQYAGLTAKIE
jgi:hypothetical protein